MYPVKSYAAQAADKPLAPYTFNRRALGPKDVLIDIKFCGICHTDIHLSRNEWSSSRFPVVPGHEIAGIVAEVGKKVKKFKKGDRAGVGCMVDSCRKCPECKDGEEQYCPNPIFTYNSFEKKGNAVTLGGYSTRIVVNEDFVLRLPPKLPLEVVAPLLCAGITTYSPLKYWKAGPGKKVGIIGLGGLGHMAVKIAKAMKADVSVLSRTRSKEKDAKRLGAKNYYAMSESGAFEKLSRTFDLLICTVSTGLDWDKYLNTLKRNGTMVILGVPSDPQPVSAGSLIFGRHCLAGSLIGGVKETQEMLNFCAKHKIVSDIELIPAVKINEAFERILKGDVRFRFVIDAATL